jgi:hypothetical protein
MACGEEVSVNVSYWTVCWWGFIPYPCKKTRTTTNYRSPAVKSFAFCCHGFSNLAFIFSGQFGRILVNFQIFVNLFR